MAISVFDEIDSTIDLQSINKVYNAFLKHFELKDDFDIELCIVDEQTIKSVNKQTRQIDSVTDVLSFPSVDMTFPFNLADYKEDIDPTSGKLLLGEIMLCNQRAIEQAEEYSHSYEREYCYLVLHGLLHLVGFDHMNDMDKQVMRNHEDKILEAISCHRN